MPRTCTAADIYAKADALQESDTVKTRLRAYYLGRAALILAVGDERAEALRTSVEVTANNPRTWGTRHVLTRINVNGYNDRGVRRHLNRSKDRTFDLDKLAEKVEEVAEKNLAFVAERKRKMQRRAEASNARQAFQNAVDAHTSGYGHRLQSYVETTGGEQVRVKVTGSASGEAAVNDLLGFLISKGAHLEVSTYLSQDDADEYGRLLAAARKATDY